MFRQWLTLVIIVLVYIPVAIDATVACRRADTEYDTGASGNELLWIIDIYSLVMAGMVLPMGALGDRIGFKRLLMLGGTLFGWRHWRQRFRIPPVGLSPPGITGYWRGDDCTGDAGRNTRYLL